MTWPAASEQPDEAAAFASAGFAMAAPGMMASTASAPATIRLRKLLRRLRVSSDLPEPHQPWRSHR